MFCKKCGTEIPEGTTLCPNCDVVPENQPAQAIQEKQPLLKKGKYIKMLAPSSVKTMSIVGIIAAILSVVFFVASYFSFFNTSALEIPLLEKSGIIEESELEDKLEVIDDMIDKGEDLLNDLERENASSDEIKVVKKTLDILYDLKDSFSITNVKKGFEEWGEMAAEYPKWEINEQEIDEILEIFNILPIIIMLVFAFCGIFTFFGGLFRKTGLVVVGLIFTSIITGALCGTLFMIMGIVLHIVLIVANVMVNSDYKKYKKQWMLG